MLFPLEILIRLSYFLCWVPLQFLITELLVSENFPCYRTNSLISLENQLYSLSLLISYKVLLFICSTLLKAFNNHLYFLSVSHEIEINITKIASLLIRERINTEHCRLVWIFNLIRSCQESIISSNRYAQVYILNVFLLNFNI